LQPSFKRRPDWEKKNYPAQNEPQRRKDGIAAPSNTWTQKISGLLGFSTEGAAPAKKVWGMDRS